MIFGVVLVGTALLAVGGAAAGSGWAAGIGGVAVLAGLGVVVRPVRFLLGSGLGLVAVAVVLRGWGWAAVHDAGDPYAVLGVDRDEFWRESAQAAALILAGAALMAALLRAPRRWWGWGSGAAGLLLLGWSAWSAIGEARDARHAARQLDTLLQPGAAASIAVQPGPDIDVRAAVAMAVLLLGAALTTSAVAARADPAAGRATAD